MKKSKDIQPAVELGDSVLDSAYSAVINSDDAAKFFRTLYNGLYIRFGQSTLSVVVSSPGDGEGKTMFSMMLAVNSAVTNQDLPTLLIDCTRDCDSIRALRMDSTPGGSLVAAGATDSPLKSIRVSGIPSLHVCQVFELRNQHRVLPHAKLDTLLKSIEGKYASIIVDCESACDGNDYVALGRLFQNVLLVTRYRHTRKQQLFAQLRALKEADCSVLGFVINRRKFAVPKWLYGR